MAPAIKRLRRFPFILTFYPWGRKNTHAGLDPESFGFELIPGDSNPALHRLAALFMAAIHGHMELRGAFF